MHIQDFANKVKEKCDQVRKETKSLEQCAALVAKTGQRNLEYAIYEEGRQRAIKELKAA